ncbi:MAG TPA: NAD(P)H-dependent oxidoreductase [Syntrophorhabdaceae bacterium]|nr:NAD(P)H-dependent oxidoreductase [Syntrophorhabdaceae bacterium]
MKRLSGSLPHVIIAVYTLLICSSHVQLASVKLASLAALIIIGAIVAGQRGASPVVKAYLVYFVLNAAGLWLAPGESMRVLGTLPASLLYACFLAVAIVPPLAGGTYFTEYFARKTTPEILWKTELFKKINRNMSWIWCGLFAASLVVGAIPVLFQLQRNAIMAVAFQILLPALIQLGIGVQVNKRYPAYYQRKIGISPAQMSQAGAARDVAVQAKSESQKEQTMEDNYKVVIINGTPHGAIGNTSQMTQMVAQALKTEGIATEEIFLAQKRIEFCVGCGVCLEKGRCWRNDDHASIVATLLEAHGLILASPVYFGHVTAQMKVFLDRSLAFGHKPRTTWKPGLAVSVSAGKGETATAAYLSGVLGTYGAFSVGALTSIAVGPGGFLGKEAVEARARDLARDLARAIKDKRSYPVTDNMLTNYLFMGDLVSREKEFMRDDYRYWQDSGLYAGFEAFVGQTFTKQVVNDEMRKEWIKQMVAQEAAQTRQKKEKPAEATKPAHSISCRELIRNMPQGFNREAAGDMKAVYQFDITGSEVFTAHLVISDRTCTYVDGPAPKPDVIIKSPAEVWLAISNGELSGQVAFMSGKYKVEGDLGLLMKLSQVFRA